MLARIARRMRTTEREGGLSLIELLVTIMLFSLIMIMITGFFMSATTSITLSRGLTENTKTASNAMSAISRAIRAGTNNPVTGNPVPDPAFVVAQRDEIVFYAYVNLTDAAERPVMYRFRVNRTTGQLTEAQWPATALPSGRWSFPAVTTTPTYSRVIAETIAPYDGGDYPFTFLKANGTALDPGTSGLSLANRQQVVAVRVTIGVQSSLTDSSRRVTLLNLVGMPNLGYTEDRE